MTAPTRQICLLILGMHRSGTSALARVLNLLGAALPATLLGAGHGNESGHWEPKLLVELHDRMLAEAGSAWNDWRKLELANLGEARLDYYKTEIRRLIVEEYGDAPLLVLKEPRICRFVPLYREILEGMGMAVRPILSLRDPVEVADSLQHRDGIDRSMTQLVWLGQVLPAERSSRDLPRAIVSYDALLNDWRSVARDVESGCRVTLREPADVAAEVETFLQPESRHFKSDEAAANAFQPSLWVREAYAHLRAQMKDDGSSSAQLDTIATELERAADTLYGAICAERSKADRAAVSAHAAQADMQVINDELTARLAAAQAAIDLQHEANPVPMPETGDCDTAVPATVEPAVVASDEENSRAEFAPAVEESDRGADAEPVPTQQAIAMSAAAENGCSEIVAGTGAQLPEIVQEDLQSQHQSREDAIEPQLDQSGPQRVHGCLLMDRLQMLRAMLPVGGRGLEIGPGYQPVCPKSEGYNVKTADYIDREGLRKKFSNANVNIDMIEEVDYITSADGLAAAIPERNCFDFILASHVIERIPEPIGFIIACSALLRDNGVLVLAVPDCRYCFDVLQPLTTTGGLIDAHLRGDKRPSPGAVFDSVAYDALRDGKIGWVPSSRGRLALNSDIAHAQRMLTYSQTSPEYVDVHMWRYVPSSFELIMNDLRAVGLIELGISGPIAPCGTEFFVQLARVPSNPDFDRERAALSASREYRSIPI